MDPREKAIDIILAEYTCLRAEICLRIRSQFFVFTAAIAIMTVLASSIKLAYETPEYTDYEKMLTLAIPFIFSAVTMIYFDQDVTVSHIARYINGSLRPSLIALVSSERINLEDADKYDNRHQSALDDGFIIIHNARLIGWEKFVSTNRFTSAPMLSIFFWISVGRLIFLFLPGVAAWSFFLSMALEDKCFVRTLSALDWILFTGGGLSLALCIAVAIWVGQQYRSFCQVR